jgi:hypothetical protein
MGRKLITESQAEIHSLALKRFNASESKQRQERLLCLEDRRFYSIAGAQWEGNLSEQFKNKPKFEVNKVHLAVIRIINEYRNNRIDAYFIPKDGAAKNELCDTCNSLYRADAQDSQAEEAILNAFEEAVGGGFGAWRLTTEYENDEDATDDRQRIRIEPIYDADSCVFFDAGAKRQDKSDGKHCFVLTGLDIEDYKDSYGDDPSSWPKSIDTSYFDWTVGNTVYVAEYYVLKERKQTIHIYRDLLGKETAYTNEDLEDPDTQTIIKANGLTESRQRKIKKKVVHKYIMSGNGILEDCGIIAGRNIPIVPCYGKRWYVDGIERCMGHVRLAKDVQRLKNMQLSKLGEISASSSIEKPIFTPEQVAGHALRWAEDNIKNYPYLLLNSVLDAAGQPIQNGPIGYTKSPSIPPAMAALLQITDQDMQDILGNQEAGEQLQPNISGFAMQLIQGKLDMQTFIYISNSKIAVKRSADIWLSMAKDLYVEPGRKMKGIHSSGKHYQIELNKPTLDDKDSLDNEETLQKADFDAVAIVGPTSASQKSAIVKSLTGMMQLTQDPQTLQVLTAMAIMNMEGEGISDIQNYFRQQLLKLGAVKPTDDEKAELEAAAANQPPDPNTELVEATAKQALAQAQKLQTEGIVNMERVEKMKAEVMQIIKEAGLKELDHHLNAIKTIGGLQQQQTQPAQ